MAINSALEEIWAARAEISAQCRNNPRLLISYYQERQKLRQARLATPEKRENALRRAAEISQEKEPQI